MPTIDEFEQTYPDGPVKWWNFSNRDEMGARVKKFAEAYAKYRAETASEPPTQPATKLSAQEFLAEYIKATGMSQAVAEDWSGERFNFAETYAEHCLSRAAAAPTGQSPSKQLKRYMRNQAAAVKDAKNG